MERYLDAARKISRLAVGDPSMPALVNIYRLDPEHPQDERVDELPFGTRGGLAVRSDFPVDATYTVKVELAGDPRDRHDLDVTVDGERVALRAVGDSGGGGRRGRGASTPPLEFSIPVKAGPHLVGVSFVQRTEARDEAILRPRMRSRGTQPAVGTVTISGPYDVNGAGRIAKPRADLRLSPSERRGRAAVRAPDSLDTGAARLSASGDRCRPRRPDAFLRRRSSEKEASISAFRRRSNGCSSARSFSSASSASRRRPLPGSLFRVSDLELASRLSFLLWSSIPDDELLDVAAAGKLKDPAVLEQQVRRMLADRRSESLVTNFAAQWLYLRDIDAKLPDEILFPDFDETLRTALRRETELFIDSVLREQSQRARSADADYTFLNERLARHYGIPNVRGSYFRRVTLPRGSPRGGLLGHGSFLTITSYSTRTSPVLRGKWVLENLLSSAPPPPPPNVPSLEVKGTEPGSRRPCARPWCGTAPRPRARGATRAWIRSASPWRISTRSASGATGTAGARSTRPASCPTAHVRRESMA